MVFSSYEFVFAFLPIVLIINFVLAKYFPKWVQHSFLLAASLYFYAYFNFSYFPIIAASILVNYFLAKIMQDKDNPSVRKLCLVLGVIFNIGMLGYFKYYDFFVENINIVFGTSFFLKNILLPLGISFFTFQQFSFLISVYKREEQLEGFIDYALFVTFFPQLVAGPIVLYSEMMPQFVDEKRRRVNFANLSKGIYIFAFGLFKKLVIADTIALVANNGFALQNFTFVTSLITMLSYTLQIYFDFSGYSDMAIGLGKMFNIDIPLNFDSPYKTESITAFWRKWHITLGRALSTYVYIPLGGNRVSKQRKYINLMATFIVSGIWHGAAWTFVLWGALHGIISVFENVFDKALKKIPHVIRVAGTFLSVALLWVLFRATSFENALNVYKGFFVFGGFNISSIGALMQDNILNFPDIFDTIFLLSSLFVLYFIVFFKKNVFEMSNKFSTTTKYAILTALILAVSVVHMSRESIFIYFNF